MILSQETNLQLMTLELQKKVTMNINNAPVVYVQTTCNFKGFWYQQKQNRATNTAQILSLYVRIGFYSRQIYILNY